MTRCSWKLGSRANHLYTLYYYIVAFYDRILRLLHTIHSVFRRLIEASRPSDALLTLE